MRVQLLIISFAVLQWAGTVFSLQCSLSESLKSEIRSYEKIVTSIKRKVVDNDGAMKNTTWIKLAKFVDEFGSRLTGTQNLENSIDYLLRELRFSFLENTHAENASVPQWIRGEESAELVTPRKMELPILGLGGSVGTPEEGITAKAIVVRTFEELKELPKNFVRGKIVVFNEEYISYGETVKYRSEGATEAAKLGAVAALIRSITPFSIASPHTGVQNYGDSAAIPVACITIEHAEMLQRMYERGKTLQIKIKMLDQVMAPVVSRNIITEIEGTTQKEEVVLVSGHIDSWDVGQGAMDDAGGAFISWRSLLVLSSLRLRPRRTIRAVLWTGEEQGYYGARSYYEQHKNEANNLTVVIESDSGTFTPTGLLFFGSENAACIMQEVTKLLAPLNATVLEVSPVPVESDIEIWQKIGIPGIGLRNKNDKYFWYHHSEGDTMTVENSEDLDLCTAVFAAVSYILADLSVALPKNESLVH